ncbi:MAG: type IV pilus assembly protein PilM [Gemmatimonadaceae bacterium]|nr:type IV pilus assembly protein PilM [Gloeobacterales cyanobacterium ES-bin-141]
MTNLLTKWLPGGPKGGIGIEITPEQVTIARLDKWGKRLRLKHLVSAPTPADALVDGRIEDTQAVAQVIRDLMSTHRIKPGPVATAISAREAVIRLIRLPADLQADELREVVLNQEAELQIPYPREEAYVDYQPLETKVDADGVRRQEVLLVAAQHEVVNSYVEAIRKADLIPKTVDIASFALIRILRNQLLQYPPTEAVALILVQAEGTVISILINGVPEFSRYVPLGTWMFREVLSRALDLPPSQTMSLLANLAPPLDSAGSTENPSFSGRGIAALRRVLGDLAEEIQRSLDFYLSQMDVLPVTRLLLSGSGANINQLDQFLAQRLTLPISRVDPLEALDLSADGISDQARSGAGVALGLGLRAM